jgi:hypothetical protein
MSLPSMVRWLNKPDIILSASNVAVGSYLPVNAAVGFGAGLFKNINQ